MLKEQFISQPYESWTTDALSSAFSDLTKNEAQAPQPIIEEKKLAIMQAFTAKLKKVSVESAENEKADNPEVKIPRWRKILRQVGYYFIFSFGFLENACGSYLFGSFLFNLIPGISNPVLIMSSLVYTVLEGVRFYGFEVAMLKDALGIPYSTGEVKKLIDTYSNQLQMLTLMNRYLSSMKMLKVESPEYQSYVKFCMLMMEEQQKIYALIGHHKQSNLKKGLKAFMIGFGALSTAAGSYFFVVSALTVLAPALIGTPIGWGVICFTVLAGLGYFYATGGSSIARVINRDYYYYQDLKAKVDVFNDEYVEDMQMMSELRTQFVKRPTESIGTQTDAPLEIPYQKSGLRLFDNDANVLIDPNSTSFEQTLRL